MSSYVGPWDLFDSKVVRGLIALHHELKESVAFQNKPLHDYFLNTFSRANNPAERSREWCTNQSANITVSLDEIKDVALSIDVATQSVIRERPWVGLVSTIRSLQTDPESSESKGESNRIVKLCVRYKEEAEEYDC